MANVEQYANLAQSTLNAGISSGDLSATLVSGSAFPSVGDYRVIVDSEIIRVTARSSNTLTIVRGQEGTSAASHSSGATVTHILTAGAIPEISARHNFRPRVSVLQVADFTWVNQGDATAVDKNGMVVLLAPRTATANLRLLVKTLPSAPYTLRVPIWFNGRGGSADCGGICLRESGSGKITSIGLRESDGLEIQKWTNETTFSALYTSIVGWREYGKPIFLQLRDDNAGTRYYEISGDGITSEIIHSVSSTDFLMPNQYGVFINPEGGTVIDRFLSVFDIVVE